MNGRAYQDRDDLRRRQYQMRTEARKHLVGRRPERHSVASWLRHLCIILNRRPTTAPEMEQP